MSFLKIKILKYRKEQLFEDGRTKLWSWKALSQQSEIINVNTLEEQQSTKFHIDNFYLLKQYESDIFNNSTTLKIMPFTKIFKCGEFVYNKEVVDNFFRPAVISIQEILSMKQPTRVSVACMVVNKETTYYGNDERTDLKLLSCCQSNFSIVIHMWKDKSQLAANVQVGEYITVIAVLCAAMKRRKYAVSTEETYIEYEEN